ncbi:hypothetical protein FHS82_000412 [Pseudochelatococcus lubricantis]|uniref:Uncharacterized protein n=1 Tax=Pseudochelatococcus lubricantis TaxID=1538102 RepID=A0ABX0UUG9_9HYPH|nr:hypothetical protein [Pseudochelatococcus lubricantis]NIJ56599.1 hypothetical protein [Pseudochelatococcus lubricantis]
MFDDDHVFWTKNDSQACEIVVEYEIGHAVGAILDSPVGADGSSEDFGVELCG